MYKLYMTSQPRYSEDIDLVQIKAEPIRDTLRELREAFSFMGEPVVKQKASNNTAMFRFESEIAPVRSLKLKIEINCREHFTVLGYTRVSFVVESGWFSDACSIPTYHVNELLGTKLRCIVSEKKGTRSV